MIVTGKYPDGYKRGDDRMKKIKVWLMTLVVMLGIHTSVFAADIWSDEEIVTNINGTIQYMEHNCTYASSNESVATVTADGTVSFHREGDVVIYITKGNMRFCHPYRVVYNQVDTAAYAAEVVRIVNEERARYGIGPVRHDIAYQYCADIRAEELTRHFSHTRPNGRAWNTALEESGLSNLYMAENIAMGYATPAQVVAGWMSSDGHRANILNGTYNHLMVGCRQGSDGALYWVQLFTRR